ncbi:DUF6541 family protein [Paenibacillus sp. Soil724D2]|uniref:DUF6541 family protein n=1 Tax=Paenibacillus sp. (strain Soil724D2) TaxID=1736392 RepID=UPI0007128027|nr:DUF6541 family protein [Paenibacillus sp. Soil724D2]KRE51069.1 hypothetical protein ASG85_19125 [Paenibacillus sp. Soil724D2]
MDVFIFGDGLWLPWGIVAASLLLFMPGYSILRVCLHKLSLTEKIVYSIPISITINSIIAMVWSYLGIPVNAYSALMPLLVICIISAVWRKPGTFRIPSFTKESLYILISILSMAGLIVVSFHNFIVPSHLGDASFHGLLTQRIADTESVLPQVTNGSEFTPPMLGKLYPFALHLHAALWMQLTGLPAYKSVIYITLLLMCLFPLFMYQYVYQLTNQISTSLISALVSIVFFMYQPLLWGAYPQITALVLVPAVLALFLRTMGRGQSNCITTFSILAMSLAALYYIHISEVFTVVLLTVPFIIFHVKNCILSRKWWLGACISALIFVLAVSPTLPYLVNMFLSSEKYMADFNQLPSLGYAFLMGCWRIFGKNGFYVGIPAFIVGCVALICQKYYRSLIYSMLAVGAIYLAVAVYPNSIIKYISFPYYNNWERILFITEFLTVPTTALGLSMILQRIKQMRKALIQNVLKLFIIVSFLFSLIQIKDFLESFQRYVILTAQGINAIHWMETHIPIQEAVLNDLDDGSYWIPSISGHLVLFNQSQGKSADYNDRLYLVQHVHEYPMNPKVTELLKTFQLKYIFYHAQVLEEGKHRLDRNLLDQNPNLDTIYSNKEVSIYQIKEVNP